MKTAIKVKLNATDIQRIVAGLKLRQVAWLRIDVNEARESAALATRLETLLNA